MEKGTVIFDGYCNFCSYSVRFIMKRDPHRRFIFVASQTEQGKELLSVYGMKEIASSSIVLIQDGEIYLRSDAALKIVRRMRGIWPLLYAFIIVPSRIRDFVYDIIAGKRYRWGRSGSCFIPIILFFLLPLL